MNQSQIQGNRIIIFLVVARIVLHRPIVLRGETIAWYPRPPALFFLQGYERGRGKPPYMGLERVQGIPQQPWC
jgi:hypothetical protein